MRYPNGKSLLKIEKPELELNAELVCIRCMKLFKVESIYDVDICEPCRGVEPGRSHVNKLKGY